MNNSKFSGQGNNFKHHYRIARNLTPPENQRKNEKNIKGLRAFVVSFIMIALVSFAFIAKNKYQQRKQQEQKLLASENSENIELDIVYISPKEVSRKIRKNNVQIVDIREPDEFKTKHIESSVNIPLSQIEENITLIEQSKEVIIVDRDDNQIGKVFADHLKSQGVDSKYLEGGIINYSNSGYTLISMGNPTLTEDMVKVTSLGVDELIAKIKEGEEYVFLDVRPELEFISDNIDGSVNIPLEKLEAKKREIPFGRILVYDSDSIRSFQAAVRLHDMNLFDVYNCLNGYEELKTKLLEAARQNKQPVDQQSPQGQ